MNVITFAYPQQQKTRRKDGKKSTSMKSSSTLHSEQPLLYPYNTLGMSAPKKTFHATATKKESNYRRQRLYIPIDKKIRLQKKLDSIKNNTISISSRVFLSIPTAVIASFCAAFLLCMTIGQVIPLISLNRIQSLGFADDEALTSHMHNFVFPMQSSTYMETSSAIKIPQIQGTVTDSVTYSTYTVQKGDSLDSITRKYGISLSTLIAMNNVENARRIAVGQKFTIPNMNGVPHTVSKNESISSIAAKYSISQEVLLDANDLTSSVIHAGQKLFIPGASLQTLQMRKAMGELFIQPLSSWRLSSAYGNRLDPFTGVSSFHTGLDMAAPHGTPIKASLDGRIAATGYTNVYGNYVIITHDGGYQTLYAHMSSYSVKKGQYVNQGALIGKVGSTGYSTGPHLHFTVYKNGVLVNPNSVLTN